MGYCIKCRKDTKTDYNLNRTWHRFPMKSKNPGLHEAWLHFVGRKQVGNFATICSDHFHPHDFKNQRSKRLKDNAVPSKSEPSPNQDDKDAIPKENDNPYLFVLLADRNLYDKTQEEQSLASPSDDKIKSTEIKSEPSLDKIKTEPSEYEMDQSSSEYENTQWTSGIKIEPAIEYEEHSLSKYETNSSGIKIEPCSSEFEIEQCSSEYETNPSSGIKIERSPSEYETEPSPHWETDQPYNPLTPRNDTETKQCSDYALLIERDQHTRFKKPRNRKLGGLAKTDFVTDEAWQLYRVNHYRLKSQIKKNKTTIAKKQKIVASLMKQINTGKKTRKY